MLGENFSLGMCEKAFWESFQRQTWGRRPKVCLRKLPKKLSHKSWWRSSTSQHLKLKLCLTDFGTIVVVFCWKLLNWGQIEASTLLRFRDFQVGPPAEVAKFLPWTGSYLQLGCGWQNTHCPKSLSDHLFISHTTRMGISLSVQVQTNMYTCNLLQEVGPLKFTHLQTYTYLYNIILLRQMSGIMTELTLTFACLVEPFYGKTWFPLCDATSYPLWR